MLHKAAGTKKVKKPLPLFYVSLVPQGTPLPASDKMTYLLARLEVGEGGGKGAGQQA